MRYPPRRKNHADLSVEHPAHRALRYNLAEALKVPETSKRASDKGRSPSRSKTPKRVVPRQAAWKRDAMKNRAVASSPHNAEVSDGAGPRETDHDALRNHKQNLVLRNATVPAQASGARVVANVHAVGSYRRWKSNLARDALRTLLQEIVPCKDPSTGAAKTPTLHPVFDCCTKCWQRRGGQRQNK